METLFYVLICGLIVGAVIAFLKLADRKPKRNVEVSFRSNQLHITTGDGRRLTIRGDFQVTGESEVE